MDTNDLKYDAFISYRHAEPDKHIAQRIQYCLESFRPSRDLLKKTGAKWFGRVFRDRDELPASSNLGEDIEKALKASRFLLVVCSLKTPLSEWVSKEIELFAEMRGSDKIITLLVEGEPKTAFPGILNSATRSRVLSDGTIKEELIEYMAADIRPEAMKRSPATVTYGPSPIEGNNLYRQSLKELKTEKLRILAPLLGCSFDDLKQRRKERMIKRIVTSVLSASLLFAAFGSFSFYQASLISSQAKAIEAMNIKVNNQNQELQKSNESIKEQMLKTDQERSRAEANEQKAIEQSLIAQENESQALTNAEIAKRNEQEAIKNLNEADRQREIARENEEIAQKNEQVAISEKNKALLNQSRFLSEVSAQRFDEGNPYLAALIALEALPKNLGDPERPFAAEAEFALRRSMSPGNLPYKPSFTQFYDFTVYDFAFSRDERKIAVALGDGTIHIYDTGNGSELKSIKAEYNVYVRLVFDENDTDVLILSDKGSYTRDHDSELNFEINGAKEDYPSYYKNVMMEQGRWTTFNKGAKITISTARSPLTAYNLELIGATDTVQAIADKNGCRIACGYGNESLEIKAFNGQISPMGNFIAAVNNNQISVYQRDLRDNLIFPELIAMNRENILAAGVQDNRTVVFDVASGRIISVLSDYDFIPGKMEFSPDSKRLVAYNWQDAPCIWDIGTSKKLFLLSGHQGDIHSVNFSPDGRFIITASDDGTARVWDAKTGNYVTELKSDNAAVYHASFSNTSKYAYALSESGILTVWDTLAWKEYMRINASDLLNPDNVVKWGIDDTVFAVIDDDDFSVTVYDTSARQKKITVKGCDLAVEDMEFSPDGKIIAIGSADDVIRLWDINGGKELNGLAGHKSFLQDFAFQKDGKYLISCSLSETIVWNVQDGTILDRLDYGGEKVWCGSDGETFRISGALAWGGTRGGSFKPLKELLPDIMEWVGGRVLTQEEKARYFME